MTLNHQRAGGAALILGTLIGVTLMLFHPSHGVAAPLVGRFTASDIVHGAALFSTPLLAYGFWRLACYVGLNKPLSCIALAFYLFGAVAVLIAATISGFVSSEAIEAAHVATGADRAVFAKIAHLSVWLNRGFAATHVGLFSIAYVLYALAWPGRGVAGALFKLLGAGVGLFVLIWLVSGGLHIGVHSMIVVVVSQGIWTILAGLFMLRSPVQLTKED